MGTTNDELILNQIDHLFGGPVLPYSATENQFQLFKEFDVTTIPVGQSAQ